MHRFLLTCLFVFYSLLSICQEVVSTDSLSSDTSINNTKVIVVQDDRINELNIAYQNTYQLKGYRVQIYSGNKRKPAIDTKLSFSKLNMEEKAHQTYEQPYFKVKVGDFRTKLEALNFRHGIIEKFPNCFIVRDNIDIAELLK